MNHKERVRKILAERPETQHDVRLLLFAVWEQDGLLPPPLEMLVRLTQPETIRRTSRRIMNEAE